MELIVLGADGTWPGRDGANSGYLVRAEGFTLWMDMGSGTLANLQRHVGLLDVNAVVITHSHADHLVDLYPYFYARHYGFGRPVGTPLFAPPGLMDSACRLLSEETAQDLASSFAVTEVEPGQGFEVGPFRARTAPMAHPVPTLGVRLEADGRTLAYSADTGPTEELVRLSAEADLLLAEATWQDDGVDYPPLHLTSRQAGEAARAADAARLLLTHIWPTLDVQRSRREAAEAFGGEVGVAEAGLRVEVGA